MRNTLGVNFVFIIVLIKVYVLAQMYWSQVFIVVLIEVYGMAHINLRR